MKVPRIVRLCLLAACGLAFFTSAAQAQDSDYSRVVRLSRTDGQVLVSHAGSDAWEDAPVNLPLQEGDALATQGGLAEVEFENGATAYLAENSVLQFTQLAFAGSGRITQLNLTQGAGTFYANLTREDSFRVITSTFEAEIPERAEFRVDAFSDGASIEVLSGTVSVSTSAGSTTFEKGQSVAIHTADPQNPDVARLPEPDSFDQWVGEQSEMIQSGNKNTLSYISSPNYYGLSDLSIYGSWVDFAGYGRSWRPFSVGLSWTPYMNGNWTLDPRLGWIWVSNEPWGWMPYHFGSWLLSPTLGWLWVPGGASGLRHWEPACVNWVRTGNQVGWVARSPNDREGKPANVEHGVVTTAGIPLQSKNRNGSNQVVAAKDLQNVVPLKQPPPEFAPHPAPVAPRSGLATAPRSGPAVAPRSGLAAAPRSGPAAAPPRTMPQPSGGNGSVVFDRGTRTFINGNPKSGPAAPGPAGLLPHSGAPQVGSAPQSNARTGGQRVTIAPPGPMDSQVPRVILPPAGIASPSRILPHNVNPPANPAPAPQAVRPGANAPPMPTAPVRPVSPPSPQPPRYVPPPPAPHAPASTPQTNSVARPAAPIAEPARPTAGTVMPRR